MTNQSTTNQTAPETKPTTKYYTAYNDMVSVIDGSLNQLEKTGQALQTIGKLSNSVRLSLVKQRLSLIDQIENMIVALEAYSQRHDLDRLPSYLTCGTALYGKIFMRIDLTRTDIEASTSQRTIRYDTVYVQNPNTANGYPETIPMFDCDVFRIADDMIANYDQDKTS